ncbi:hypothetical protein GGR34_003694 [Microvirga flocculans]|uniref:Uncharacterized protein n=1 Tax=Microvirga flocculans TaxID=217168 RepID=A0A7W6IIL4_9HYPH|nr:hypothetical protein [Microvirga flocculans]MBB4042009.1 hypothetical protein [Microvirga flocculans]
MAIEISTDNRDYPLPHEQNDLDEDVLRIIAALQMIDLDVASIIATLGTKAAAVHSHGIDQINGLALALQGKSDADHIHSLNDLNGVDVSGAANGQFLKLVGTAWTSATIAISDVASLGTTLQNKADLFGNSLAIPYGPTSARPANSPLHALRYNTTLGYYEYFRGGTWNPLQVMDALAKSQNLADLADKDAAIGNLGAAKSDGSNLSQNLLINSEGQYNQRGISGSTHAAGVYFRDRWQAGPGGAVVNIGVFFSSNTLRYESTWELSAGSIEQIIEPWFLHADRWEDRQVTFAVDDLREGSITVTISGDASSGSAVSATLTPGSGVRAVSLMIPAALSGAMRVNIARAAGVPTTVRFKRPRIGIGSTPPLMLQRDELALCQRYYCRREVHSIFRPATAGLTHFLYVYWPVEMRAAPTLTLLAGSRTGVSSAYLDTSSKDGCRHVFTSSLAGVSSISGDVVVADAEIVLT